MNTEKICNACGCVIEGEAVEINGLFYCADCDANEDLWVECYECGKRIFVDDIPFIAEDGEHFCSKQCMDLAGYSQCCYCEEIHKMDEMIAVEYYGSIYRYCSEDCAVNDDNEFCSVCGRWYPSSQTRLVNTLDGEKEIVCDSCFNWGDYFYCDECEEYYDNKLLWHSDGNISICDNCCSDWNICEGCGTLIHSGDTYWDDDEAYCEDCYDNCSEADEGGDINEWNYKPCVDFYSEKYPCGCSISEGENPFMGVELEVDKGDKPRDLATEVTEVGPIYCKHDGSLERGVEIVSHPCTLWYHTNEMNWEEIMRLALNRGFRSHDTTTCGLHVHVNRNFFGNTKDEQDLHIAKIILIVNRFWDSHIVPFTRRGNGEINQWARKNNSGRIYKSDSVDEKRKKTIDAASSAGRYVAVNLQNRATIEFRIFRGTLKYSTFLATLQFVDTLCRFVKTLSIDDVDNLVWEDIFVNINYPELTNYLSERTNFDPQKANPVFKEPITKSETPRTDVKPGDRIIIRDWNDMANEYGSSYRGIDFPGDTCWFSALMRDLCGETGRVTAVCQNYSGGTRLDIDWDNPVAVDDYIFCPQMIDIIN